MSWNVDDELARYKGRSEVARGDEIEVPRWLLRNFGDPSALKRDTVATTKRAGSGSGGRQVKTLDGRPVTRDTLTLRHPEERTHPMEMLQHTIQVIGYAMIIVAAIALVLFTLSVLEPVMYEIAGLRQSILR